MATLTNQAPGASYGGLLTCENAGNTGLTGTLQNIIDGVGHVSALQLSTTAAKITGVLQVQTLANNPAAPVSLEGTIYINTDGTLRYYVNGGWLALTGV